MARTGEAVDQEQPEPASTDGVLRELDVDPEQGLSESEARERLGRYGENKLEEEHTNPLLRLLKHFWGPIPWLIEAALLLVAVISLLPSGESRWLDFAVILAMLVINVAISYWHEGRAERSIAALKEQLAPRARVVRGGEQQELDAANLVPGDILRLRLGDVVPADACLLEDQTLSLDESALTGESLPADKAGGEQIYSGTSIKQGEAVAVVNATGGHTRFAGIVGLVQEAGEESHFTRAVQRIGYFLIALTIVILTAVVLVALLVYGNPILTVLVFAVGVLIASIPAAMPAVLSATMTVGAQRLAQYKAIVARLTALEEIAGLKTLFVDKTGTLTTGEVEVQDLVVLDADEDRDVLLAAALTCRREEPDDIDQAILSALDEDQTLDQYDVLDFQGFDPSRKRAEARVRADGDTHWVAKGAPQAILELSEGGDELRQRVEREVEQLGEQGLRALGVAREESGGWRYLGILPLLDPPRESTEAMIRETRGHGVDLRMLTGDHDAVGAEIARQVGLGDNIVAAGEVFEGEGEDMRVEDRADDLDGLARVAPEHKYHLVQHFQAGDRIVGMTGDGINDAPALRQADAGVAVSGATDAARSAADLVLTEPGLGVITRAVEEARRIFERMISYATYRITETVRLLLFFGGAVVIYNVQPVTPIMIVLLAIFNDIPIMTMAWDNAPTTSRPVRWDMPRVLTASSVMGAAGVCTSFLAFWAVRDVLGLDQEAIKTVMFLKLLVAGHMTIYLCRSRNWFFSKPWPNPWMIVALEATQILGTLMAAFGWLMPALEWKYIGLVWGYALVCFLLLDVVKHFTFKLLDRVRAEP